MSENNNYTFVIKPKRTLWEIDLKEIWRYRDLLFLLVKRDFISVYKQTILGPVWFFIQPLLITITFTIIFGQVAKISTGGAPEILFYFPRLIVPLSVIISNLMKLGIQLLLLLMVWVYYIINSDAVHPQIELLLMPFYLLVFALMGLGFGLIFSALTTKYRDLTFLIAFGVQLLMYASAVIFPASVVPADKQWILFLNPLVSLMEAIKYSFLGQGIFSWFYLAYSTIFTAIILVIGVLVFNKVEKGFIDTV